MQEKPCPFCDPKEVFILSDDLSYAMLSNPRKVPGHLLVIPRRHIERPWELTAQETTSIFGIINRLQQKILDHLAPGCDVRQNYRPFMPQSRLKVDHVHYHLIPRAFKDDIYKRVEQFETDLFEDLSPDEMARVSLLLSQ